VVSDCKAQDTSVSYLQVFRNGIVEAVDARLIRVYDGKGLIPGNGWEDRILASVTRYTQIQASWGCSLLWSYY
jgi:hypothetical protein